MHPLGSVSLVYLGIFSTGTTALIFQIVWQKYLTFIVGSEARSISLVLAVFLASLCLGYEFWGRVSDRVSERHRLLKWYGAVEACIGIWAVLFVYWYNFLSWAAFQFSASLWIDFLASCFVVGPPAFLMGATVPMLTRLLPSSIDQVNRSHTLVYGWNTLGAVFGAPLAALFLIPTFGLPTTLCFAGVVNLMVGAAFVLNRFPKEQLKGISVKIQSGPQFLKKIDLMVIAAFSGMIIISLEVLWTRIIGLTVGSGVLVFPITVSLFVLGIGLGSLSLRSSKISPSTLVMSFLWALTGLLIVYNIVPFLPLWLNRIRLALPLSDNGYILYQGAQWIVFGIIIVPLLIPLGRLLPLSFCFLQKKVEDVGSKCGHLYFWNGMGTIVGSLFLSHMLLHWLDIDRIFQINITLLALLGTLVMARFKAWKSLGASLLIVISIWVGPRWDRAAHELGLFRVREVGAFLSQGWFKVPRLENINREFFEDAPNSTVAVYTTKIPMTRPGSKKRTEHQISSLIVNGKSDGNSSMDYSTMALSAFLPFVFSEETKPMNVAVIGLGTGVTASLFASSDSIKNVEVLEISSAVIRAGQYFDRYNGDLSKNKKVKILKMDAFRFFARTRERYDIIASEPSTLWVTGVENLFTAEYYKLVKANLSQKGVFFQWLQLGETTNKIFGSVLRNLAQEFPHLQLYKIGPYDAGIVASMNPLRLQTDRFESSGFAEMRYRLQLENSDWLSVLEVFNGSQIRQIARNRKLYVHSLESPRLALAAGGAVFVGGVLDMEKLMAPELRRHFQINDSRQLRVKKIIKDKTLPEFIQHCSGLFIGERIACTRISKVRSSFAKYRSKSGRVNNPKEALDAYGELRNRGMIPADPEFLRSIEDQIVREPALKAHRDALPSIIRESAHDRRYTPAVAFLKTLNRRKALNDLQVRKLIVAIANSRRRVEAVIQSKKVVE